MKRGDFSLSFQRVTGVNVKKRHPSSKSPFDFSLYKSSDTRCRFFEKWLGTKAFLYPIFTKKYCDLVKKYWNLVKKFSGFVGKYRNFVPTNSDMVSASRGVSVA